MKLSHFLITIATLGLAVSSASAQFIPIDPKPDITGSAGAPLNIPLTFSNMVPTPGPNGTMIPPVAASFTFSITAKDMDTYREESSSTLKEFFDSALECDKVSEQYATISGPTLRGFAADGTGTWDIVGRGVLIPLGTPPGASPLPVTYLNRYRLYNKAIPGVLRPIVLNDADSFVIQTLIRPGF